MAEKVAVVKMLKHFNQNMIGEVCSFSKATAEHILKYEGAILLGYVEPGVEKWDIALGKVVSLKSPTAKA